MKDIVFYYESDPLELKLTPQTKTSLSVTSQNTPFNAMGGLSSPKHKYARALSEIIESPDRTIEPYATS